MSFKIRRPASVLTKEDVELYELREAEYERFLQGRRERIPTCLWRYFRSDFFHEGAIQGIEHSPSLDSVVLSIWCPNIKRLSADGFDFVNVLFRVHCAGVSRFAVERDRESASDIADSNAPAKYISSEIDTALDIAASAAAQTWDAPHSLIIDAGDRWIVLVFASISVEAAEAAAFALMESDPRFEVPK